MRPPSWPLALLVCVLGSTSDQKLEDKDGPLPIFIRGTSGTYLLSPTSKDKVFFVTNKEMRFRRSQRYDAHVCTILVKKERHLNAFLKLWPLLKGQETFYCLILERSFEFSSQQFPEHRGEDEVDGFASLVSLSYKKLDPNSILERLQVIDEIIRITDRLRIDVALVNEVWKIIMKNSRELLKYDVVNKGIITNHLDIQMLDLSQQNFAKINGDIYVHFDSNFKEVIIVGNLKSSKLFVWKHYSLSMKRCVIMLQRSHKVRKIYYVLQFKVPNMDRRYECLKKDVFNYVWDNSICETTAFKFNNSAFVSCKCTSEGLISVGEVERLMVNSSALYDYWGYGYPWDFLDDLTKYRKENAMRYLPVITVMRVVIMVVSIFTLLAFLFLGLVLLIKNKRIFYAMETISVVIFLTILCSSHFMYHFMAYVGLVWKRLNMGAWCSFVTFFHFNYVLTLCAFQTYVFIVAVSHNAPWLHNIALPILLAAGPVAAGLIDGMATVFINKGCNFLVFNLTQYITFFFILLPCAFATILAPAMAMCTFIIINQTSRLYGFIGSFLFSSIHVVGGVFLLLANSGETIEMQYYFQFCVVAIVESLYMAMLAVLLLILSNTNTSLLDRHCTFDIDTKELTKYFDEPKTAIQLLQKL